MSPSGQTDESSPWTPLRVMDWAVPYLKERGVDSPRLDVECMLAEALGCDRLRVYLQYDRPLSADERKWLRDAVGRRAKREPLAYILGTREFFGHDFSVRPGVLIPRPESELLVDEAAKILRGMPEDKRIAVDLGTGSGCLAVSLALAVPETKVWAVELSGVALAVAQENAERLGAAPFINFRQGSWWDALKAGDPAQFAVVMSNPPYLTDKDCSELQPEISDFEPLNALKGGADGLLCYQTLRMGLPDRLTPGGWAFLEMNAGKAAEISEIFASWRVRKILPDLAGLPRVLCLSSSAIP